MRTFALIRMSGEVPDIDLGVTPFHGFVLCDRIPTTNWGAYLVSGTGPQLVALDALPQVLGILAFTRSDAYNWGPDMDNTIPTAVRTKINTWLTAHGQPNVPASWTYKRFIKEAFKRFNPHFDINNFDIVET